MGTGMSRAAEAREAVALKRAKTDREEREKTALKERREAIEAARRAFVFGTTAVYCVCFGVLPGSFTSIGGSIEIVSETGIQPFHDACSLSTMRAAAAAAR